MSIHEPTRSAGEVVDPAKYSDHPYEQQRCRLIAEQIPDGQNRPALDVGSGPGIFTRMLAERGWRVDAVDAAFLQKRNKLLDIAIRVNDEKLHIAGPRDLGYLAIGRCAKLFEMLRAY